jgi:erythromycin esterase-like protein
MIDEELAHFLDSLPARPWLLGLGEPTHLAEAFLTLRNEVFRWLVEHEGYRAIAIESDCLAGLVVDEFVAGGSRSLDEVMATGFSHNFGESEANRELVAWMRLYNEQAAPADRLRFYGFDGPTEMMYAPSPRGPLAAVHAYLAEHLDGVLLPSAEMIDDLAGADARWADEAAMLDPSRSIGSAADAVALRLLADDLVTLLEAEAPALIAATSRDAWERACLQGRTAARLLHYHAAMADPSDARFSGLMYRREVMMAANLRAIAERGPTLVFAQNSHLQKVASSMDFFGVRLRWWSAGALVAATTDHRYAFLATAVGSIPARGLDAPPPDTLEGVLAAQPAGILPVAEVRAALRGRDVVPRTDMTPQQGYAPLDPQHFIGADGVVFVPKA